jgi:ferredoxin-NADP reductase
MAEVPHYQQCTFYLSGPPSMVEAFKDMLNQMHVKPSQIKTDLFAGLV